jgi:hypothetical protein
MLASSGITMVSPGATLPEPMVTVAPLSNSALESVPTGAAGPAAAGQASITRLAIKVRRRSSTLMDAKNVLPHRVLTTEDVDSMFYLLANPNRNSGCSNLNPIEKRVHYTVIITEYTKKTTPFEMRLGSNFHLCWV